jgi:hypothetical protein
MNALFDSAALAIVAYAEVASDGTSTATNSGITTAKTATGTYTLTLPANKAQADATSMVLVTPKGALDTVTLAAKVVDTSDSVKTVVICNGTTTADAAFSVLILRTVVPAPAGAPA